MKLKSIMMGVATLAMASSAWAGPINTGAQAGFATWFLGSTGTGTAAVTLSGIPAAWEGPTNGWIGSAAGDSGQTGAVGFQAYSIILGTSGTFTLSYLADNSINWTGVGVTFLTNTGNTTSIDPGGASAACTATNCFQNGVRILTGSFTTGAILIGTVNNVGPGTSPTGLLVTASSVSNSGAVPEPSTYAMMGLGGAALLFARLRRK